MNDRIRPMGSYIMIKELENNGDVTPEGVVIPEAIQRGYELGAVVETHDGQPMPDGTIRESALRQGNLVAYTAGAGVPMHIGGLGFRFIFESNVVAVLEEDCRNSAQVQH